MKDYNTRMAIEDRRHIHMAYVQLHEALNELQQVYKKDNILAHAARTLGAIEDTMYEYVIDKGGKA